MNKVEILKTYEKAITGRLDKFLSKIEKNESVKSASLKNNKVHIEFAEPVDIEGQNVLNVFIYGGAIKKSDSKDNIDEQYFQIPAIGDF